MIKNSYFEYFNKFSYEKHYSNQLYSSIKNNLQFVQRLECVSNSKVHNGCVNTICWNEEGRLVLSGSDDLHLVISDPFTQQTIFKHKTNHRSNIFCAKFMPMSSNHHLISSSADGMIVWMDVNNTSQAAAFTSHRGPTYELATIVDDRNVFLSCGNDGTTRSFDLRTNPATDNSSDDNILVKSKGATLSIASNHMQPCYFMIGCSDGIVRLYDRRMVQQQTDENGSVEKIVNANLCGKSHRITSLSYNQLATKLLVSYSAQHVYLFDLNAKSELRKMESLLESCLGESEETTPIRHVRLRGDWSDTGPSSRPLQHPSSEVDHPLTLAMRGMSRIMTNWFERRVRTNQATQPSADLNQLADSHQPADLDQAADLNQSTDRDQAAHQDQAADLNLSTDSYQSTDRDQAAYQYHAADLNQSSDSYQSIDRDQVADQDQAADLNQSTDSYQSTDRDQAADQDHAADYQNESIDQNELANQKVSADQSDSKSQDMGPLEDSLCNLSNYPNLSSQFNPTNPDPSTEFNISIEDITSTKCENTCDLKKNQSSKEGVNNSSAYIDSSLSNCFEQLFIANNNSNSENILKISAHSKGLTLNDNFTVNPTSDIVENLSDNAKNNTNLYEPAINNDSLSASAVHNSGTHVQSASNYNLQSISTLTGQLESMESELDNFNKPEDDFLNGHKEDFIKCFKGHRNTRTVIKEASFWGDRYVLSGSDCGHIFIWDADTTELVALLPADRHVVNCVQPHQQYPALVSSGIDYDIKLWMPTASQLNLDTDMAFQVMRRNRLMMEQTRDTVTVPASFIIRLFALLNRPTNRNDD